MNEKQPVFFFKIEENGRINNLGDEFIRAFTPNPPEVRNSENKL